MQSMIEEIIQDYRMRHEQWHWIHLDDINAYRLELHEDGFIVGADISGQDVSVYLVKDDYDGLARLIYQGMGYARQALAQAREGKLDLGEEQHHMTPPKQEQAWFVGGPLDGEVRLVSRGQQATTRRACREHPRCTYDRGEKDVESGLVAFIYREEN